MVIEYFLEWVETASVAKRTEAASALVRAYLRDDISSDEAEDVEAVLTTLLEDPAPGVRQAIAQAFGARKKAPRHIISALAEDSADVAIIALSQSPVLHDTELAELIRTSETDKQIAIACRPWISLPLANKIASHADKEACTALLMNPVTHFTEENLHVIAERFGEVTEIRCLLLERDDLAAETKLLLINKLGSALGNLVSNKGWLNQARAEKVVNEACDKASINFVANASSSDVRHLVSSMILGGQITVNYLLRAVCMGNISLVAHAISELSGIRIARVEAILTQNHKSAFKALYDRAGLPENAFMIFQAAISSWRRVLAEDAEINPARLSYLVTREVLENYHGQKDVVVDELVLQLRKLSAEMARESSRVKAIEIANRVAEAEIVVELIDDAEAASDVQIAEDENMVLIAGLEDDLRIMEESLVLEVQESIEEIDVQQETSEFVIEAVEPVSLEEIDYRPDISEEVRNIALSRAA